MKVSRIIFVILQVVFAIIAVAILVRWITNRNSTELILQPSNIDYTRWELPEGAKARLGKGSINDIKFSPDGTRFAVATTIGVWMYDAKTGKEISLFKGERQDIKGIAFSADGSLLTGANSTGGIPRWDANTGQLHSILIKENVRSLNTAVFSEDGTKLVSVGRPHDEIQIWNLTDETTSPIIADIDMDFKNGQLTAIALSPDSRFLATAIHEWKKVYPIQMWNADTEEQLFILTGHERRIKSLTFSPDGKTLASGDEYRTIHLWNMDTKTTRATFKAPSSFYALSFSPNGKLLASGCGDGSVRLWNATAKQQGLGGKIGQYLPTLTLKGHKDGVSELVFSPDGRMLLTGSDDGTIRAWNTITGKQQFTCPGHTNEISGLAVSDGGKTLVSVHSSENQLLRWDINVGHHLSGYYFRYRRPEAISSDGKTLAIKDWRAKNTIKMWDTSKKRIKATLKGHEDSPAKIPNFEFSLNGNRLASTGTQQGISVIHLWNIPNQSQPFLKRLFFNSKTMRPIHILQGVGSVLTFSPNGKMLASGSSDRVIHLWDVELGSSRLMITTGHEQRIRALAFSPDGKMLVSGENYKTFYLWDVATGQQLAESQTVETVKTLKFSPDGSIIVSGTYNGKIQLLDAHTLRLLSTHIGHTSRVSALIFLEDKKTLASASEDGTILLWDWEKLRLENK